MMKCPPKWLHLGMNWEWHSQGNMSLMCIEKSARPSYQRLPQSRTFDGRKYWLSVSYDQVMIPASHVMPPMLCSAIRQYFVMEADVIIQSLIQYSSQYYGSIYYAVLSANQWLPCWMYNLQFVHLPKNVAAKLRPWAHRRCQKATDYHRRRRTISTPS